MFPIILQSPYLTLYSYPLMMGLAWGVGYQKSFHLLLENSKRPSLVYLWYISIFLTSWMGAKLLFWWNVPDNLSFTPRASFWLGGGFVFYGGLLAVLLTQIIWSRFYPAFHWNKMKPLLSILILCHALGRIGCFLAGCCYGHPLKNHYFTHVPIPLFESLGLFILYFYFRQKRLSTWSHYFMGYGLLRFILEFWREDKIRGMWGMWTPSQWISLILILVGLYISITSKPHLETEAK
jgi:phosphatidylglycerol---prolipoprotein diacylglyceryl transferase